MTDNDSPVLGAIIHRIMVGRTDLLAKYGPQSILAAAEDVADYVGDVEEIGSSDVSGWVKQVERMLEENPPEAFGVKEDVDPADAGEYDREGDMAKSDLRSIMLNASRLHDMLGDSDNLPEWVQSKLTVAEDYLSTVVNYLASQAAEPMADMPESVDYEKSIPPGADEGRLKWKCPACGVASGIAAFRTNNYKCPNCGEPLPAKNQLGLKHQQGVAEGANDNLAGILARHADAVEEFKQGGEMSYDLESDLWDYYFSRGDIRNYDADASGWIAEQLADYLGLDESVAKGFASPKQEAKIRARLKQVGEKDPDNVYKIVADEFDMTEDELRDALNKSVAEGKTGNAGYDSMLAVMKAVDAGKDATFDIAGEPITLEYPEARFLAGKYKAFLKAGRQEEFLKYMENPVTFDRLMKQLRDLIDKQKNFRGSVPGERGVEEAAPGLVKAAAGLAVGGLAAAGAPAIVGILGPLLGIPMAAYGAYSAAKLGMQGVEKLWDMATDKLGSSEKVEQYTKSQIAKLPPEQAQAASAVIKQVAESRVLSKRSVTESADKLAKYIASYPDEVSASLDELKKKIEAEAKNSHSRFNWAIGKMPDGRYVSGLIGAIKTFGLPIAAQGSSSDFFEAKQAKNPYAIGMAQAMKSTGDEPPLKKSTIKKAHKIADAIKKANESLADNEYWCGIDKKVKLVPEGYKKLATGYITRI